MSTVKSQEILEKSQNMVETQPNTQKHTSRFWTCPILFDLFIFLKNVFIRIVNHTFNEGPNKDRL